MTVKDKSAASKRLAKSLQEATQEMMRPGSMAREVLGDAFVDHFGATREHEWTVVRSINAR